MGEKCLLSYFHSPHGWRGIGTLKDIELVLDAGADKVSMNSAAVRIRLWFKRPLNDLDPQK